MMMSREQYLYELNKRLSAYPEEFRNEIMDSFMQHFEDAKAEGKSDEEIIAGLGSIDEVLQNIENYDQVKTTNLSDSFRELSSGLGNIGRIVKDIFRDLSSGASFTFSFSADDNDYEEVEDWYGVSDILFDSSMSDCDISVTRGDTLRYSFTTNRPEDADLKIERRDERLYLSIERNIRLVPTVSSRLKLQIPEEIRNVYLNGVSGDISINDINLGNIVVNSVSGDLEMQEVSGNQCVYKATSGDLDVNDCHLSQLSIDTTSGDVEIHESECDLMIKTTSGDCDITSHRGRILVEAISGDIEIEMENASEISCNTKSGDIDLEISDGNFTAEVSTISGDISTHGLPSVRKNRGHYLVGNGKAGIVLRTLSGDVTIRD